MGRRSHHKARHVRQERPPLPLGHLMRTSCNECGAPVEWIGITEAHARGIDLTDAQAFIGGPIEDVWICTACDNFGVMGSPEFGTL